MSRSLLDLSGGPAASLDGWHMTIGAGARARARRRRLDVRVSVAPFGPGHRQIDGERGRLRADDYGAKKPLRVRTRTPGLDTVTVIGTKRVSPPLSNVPSGGT